VNNRPLPKKKIVQRRLAIRRRLDIYTVFIIAIFCILVFRAIDLAYVHGGHLAHLAEKQTYRSKKIYPPRGRILDRNGRVLAESQESYSLYAIASAVTESDLEKISKITGYSKGYFRKLLAGHKGFVRLIRDLPIDVYQRISSTRFRGFGVERYWRRVHPQGSVVGNLVGFINRDGKGIEGLEYAFDKVLSGLPGRKVYRRDARGHILPGSYWETEPVPGKDVVLSLDLIIQSIAYAALEKGVKAAAAKAGSVVVFRPRDGAVLALATYPSYNPASSSRRNPELWRNRPVQDIFEPGSTMKPFTMAAALESGLFKPDSSLFCEHGKYKVANRIIHDDHPAGTLTMSEIIQKSSNICSAKLAQAIGSRPIYALLTKVNFGKKTGSGLPGEAKGILHPPEKWGPVELATISFGQGIAVTLLQLAAGYGIFANHGTYVRPHILLDPAPGKGAAALSSAKGVITPEVATQVLSMLKKVTRYGGTAPEAAPQGYLVAGKTGTAQKPSPRGGYSKKYIGAFVGIAPADHPELVIAVIIDEPHKSHYGGVVAAPVFREIAASVLPYYGYVPDPVLVEKRRHERAEYYRKLASKRRHH